MIAPNDRVLPSEELIGLADLALQKMHEDMTEEDALKVVYEIVELCMTQGMLAAKDDPDDVKMYNAMAQGNVRWKTIVEYAKDVLEIQLHPLAFIMISKSIVADAPELKPMVDALDRLLKEISEKAASDLKPIEVVPVDDIDETMSKDDLAKEFFTLWWKLGTFHQNRDDYETEEEKAMHDRIVAVFNRLGRKIPEIYTI